jgi:oxygen-independent coproporphyrinogen-3 oxidase
MHKAIIKEIELQKSFLKSKQLDTIYFGGGTPSVYEIEKIEEIINTIEKYWDISDNAEISFEANPDDLKPEYIDKLAKSKINRLSIGIQSFNDDELKFMNRRHNSQEAIRAINLAQEKAFDNISIDLIYGLPNSNIKTWEKSLNKAFELNIQHISAYHLSIEENTVFAFKKSKSLIKEIDENLSFEQYKLLKKMSKEHGFINYEVSNFAIQDYHSKHNSNYWKQNEYLGIGPSAHSYNMESRYWNVNNNKSYLEYIEKNSLNFESEKLSDIDRYNEYIMCSLRTIWGIDTNYIFSMFSDNIYQQFKEIINKYKDTDLMENYDKSKFRLTEKGIFISNELISNFFILD